MRALPRPPRDEAHAASLRLGEVVAGTPEFAKASCIALFASLPDEIDTRPLFERARAQGRRCLLPRLVAGSRRLEFAEARRWEDLAPGEYGALAPAASRPAVALAAAALVLVPGLAFDRSGRRLGRGAGHYDRALAECAAGAAVPVCWGVAYAAQVVDRVPTEAHDRGVDAVACEEGLLRVVRSPERARE